jgi:transcriptional regulator with XRE-family HTH domain
MTGNATDQIDQLVKARWLAIGLSQSDLAEVLGAAIKQTPAEGDASKAAAGRLMQIADALGFPPNFVRSSVETRQETRQETREDHSPEQSGGSLQSLLDLRLLRAFRELHDHRSKRMLIHLAEQMVRRQANRHGDAG